MSAVRDVIKLGKLLEAAEEKVARLDSIDQAIAESEARLADLRGFEAQAKHEIACCEETARTVTSEAKKIADATLKVARGEAREIVAEAERVARVAAKAGEEACSALAARQSELAESCLLIEAEETRLAQSVTALKAELEQLRSRILG